jgi:hypothetical protein
MVVTLALESSEKPEPRRRTPRAAADPICVAENCGYKRSTRIAHPEWLDRPHSFIAQDRCVSMFGNDGNLRRCPNTCTFRNQRRKRVDEAMCSVHSRLIPDFAQAEDKRGARCHVRLITSEQRTDRRCVWAMARRRRVSPRTSARSVHASTRGRSPRATTRAALRANEESRHER